MTDETISADLLPNFCSNRGVLLVVLIAELLAMVLTLGRGGSAETMIIYFAYASMFIQSVALCDAGLLCLARQYLHMLRGWSLAAFVYILLQCVTLLLSEISWWVMQYVGAASGVRHFHLLLHNLCISAIITAVAMRYFYIRHQQDLHQRAETEARVAALQARIRPHFLFNSMNTIASLVHDKPDAAESAVLDLADLFRSTLSEQRAVSLAEEIDIVRRYLRMEQLRLGDRLSVQWNIPDYLLEYPLPALILQPLVENAVYHGIEPLRDGGQVVINGHDTTKSLILSVINPVREKRPSQTHARGNRMAVDNIRQRLKLAYGDAASLRMEEDEGEYRVFLVIPKVMELE
ncbi:MAG: histidine kinase [Gammaproteobacteria bacterium]|nr:histidine kinase [Gammaproteobacteria bacterium]